MAYFDVSRRKGLYPEIAKRLGRIGLGKHSKKLDGDIDAAVRENLVHMEHWG
ncbi:hypothetical protein M1408_02635 [Candidatus Marsarchaeota archaeon]|jgi:hypothetical protein|nr:hypothetical protein [Candidatus Marsarchaeota archaeon]